MVGGVVDWLIFCMYEKKSWVGLVGFRGRCGGGEWIFGVVWVGDEC